MQSAFCPDEAAQHEITRSNSGLPVDAVGRFTPSARGEALILDWSNKYGLLGVLPSSIQMMVLPPIYEPTLEADSSLSSSKPWIVQRKHARLAGTWITQNHREEDPSERVEGARPGDAVDRQAGGASLG